MKPFSRRLVIGSSIALSAVVLLIGFQNCQKLNFEKDYSSSSLSVNIQGSATGNNTYYTNQKTVLINVSTTSQHIDEVRASLDNNMDEEKVPWQSVKTGTLTLDLGSHFAADGSKDGLKTIYIEGRDSSSNYVTSTSLSQVFLDTQAPSLTARDILSTGVSGKGLKKGDSVQLNWAGVDKVALSGVASGLDPQSGLRWGISPLADCSESSLTQKSEWGPYTDNMTVSWPEGDPLKAFYFCIYGKDLAGNVGTLLSQPMTGIWQVLAGDNNPGNGGSVTAKNVRFTYPLRIAVDSGKNIYVYDRYANVIRKISTDGTIYWIAGNGVSGGMSEGDATLSSLSVTDFAFDSKDRLYMAGAGGIWRLTLGGNSSQKATIFKWASNMSGNLRINIDRKSDTLYMSTVSTSRSTASDSYIYKISLDEVDKNFPAKTRPTMTDLKSKYLWAGNGVGMASTDSFPPVILASSSLGYPNALGIGDAGEIYYATSADGSGYPFGHHQVRMLKQDANGVLQNYLVTTQVAWVHQIQFMHYTDGAGVEQKYLLAATDDSGLKRIDLKSGVVPVANSSVTKLDPYSASETLHPYRVGGVAALFQSINGKNTLQKIVMSESNNSRMSVLNPDLSLSIKYGRPVYDSGDKLALESMVNIPDGVVQAKNNDIYFSEPLSHIIRKVDSAGQISVVTGTPGKAAKASDTGTVSFSNFTFNGNGYTNSFRYGLVYDSQLDRLYFMDGAAARVRLLNLMQNTVSTFGPLGVPRSPDQEGWYPYGATVAPVGTNRDLYVLRSNPYYPNQGTILKKYNSSTASSSVVAGTGTTGVVTSGVVATSSNLSAFTGMTMDSRLNIYFGGNDGIYKIDAATNIISKLTSVSAAGLQLVENAGEVHLFGVKTTSIVDVKIATTGQITTTTLCLPGTILNSAIQVSLANDGNLLIADSKNNRILKYYIRDGNGQIKLFDQTCQ